MNQRQVLVFLPGFLAPPSAYDDLLAPCQRAGIEVHVPRLYRPTVPVLIGKFDCAQEAERAAAFITSLNLSPNDTLVLGGHSRGGQAALRAALSRPSRFNGLILIDPVDGGSPRHHNGFITDQEHDLPMPIRIIGAGKGGNCAPSDRNYEVFTRSLPTASCRVISTLGHADVMSGLTGSLGQRACGPKSDTKTRRRLLDEVAADIHTFTANVGG